MFARWPPPINRHPAPLTNLSQYASDPGNCFSELTVSSPPKSKTTCSWSCCSDFGEWGFHVWRVFVLQVTRSASRWTQRWGRCGSSGRTLSWLPAPKSSRVLSCSRRETVSTCLCASDSLATYGAIEMCFDCLIDWLSLVLLVVIIILFHLLLAPFVELIDCSSSSCPATGLSIVCRVDSTTNLLWDVVMQTTDI